MTDAEHAHRLRQLSAEASLYAPIRASGAALERAIELLEAPRLGMAIAPLCVRLGCAVIHGDEAEAEAIADENAWQWDGPTDAD